MWPFSKKAAKSNTQTTQAITGVVQGRPDYYVPYGQSLGYLPPVGDPVIIDALRTAIPVMDSAIDMLVKLTGNAELKWDNDTVQEEWDAWVQSCTVAPLENGFNSWLNGFQERKLMYGLACSEVLFDEIGKDVFGFQYLSAQSLRMRTNPDNPVLVDVLQQQAATPMPVLLDKAFIAIQPNKPRDNSPYGRSLFSDCPFVGEMLLEIAHATKQNWNRVGAPSFAVTVDVPANLDPSVDVGSLMDKMIDGVKRGWLAAMTKRKKGGNVTDFFGAGSINIKAIGADGQILEMAVPWRAAMEQIVGVTHLPAWMLSLHWSTTERLSSEQAKALELVIKDYQDDLSSVALWAAYWWAVVRGYANVGRECEWPELGIRDRVQLAQEELYRSNAQANREKTFKELWRNGVVDQQGYAEGVMDDECVEIVTPMAEPVATAAPNPFGGVALNSGHTHTKGCSCGQVHKSTSGDAHVSYGSGETPNDDRIGKAIDDMYGDAKAAVNKLQTDVFRALALPNLENAAGANSTKAIADVFELSAESESVFNKAVDLFVKTMYGDDLTRVGFVADDTGDGIIQQYDWFAHSIGAQRVAEFTSESVTSDIARNSEAVKSFLGSAFDRLSDSGKNTLGEGVRSGLYDIIETNIALGSSPLDVARDMGSYFDGYAGYQMERLARTEIAFAQVAGQTSELQAQGIDTSATDANPPPYHPNCLCDLTIEKDEDGNWRSVPNISASACDLCQAYGS